MEFDYFDIVLLGVILTNRLHIFMQSRNFILNMTMLQGTQYVRGSHGICDSEPVNTQKRVSIFSGTPLSTYSHSNTCLSHLWAPSVVEWSSKNSKRKMVNVNECSASGVKGVPFFYSSHLCMPSAIPPLATHPLKQRWAGRRSGGEIIFPDHHKETRCLQYALHAQ